MGHLAFLTTALVYAETIVANRTVVLGLLAFRTVSIVAGLAFGLAHSEPRFA